ncbi:DUF5133 domain-containing protein [Streptomyces sp. NPDC091272]|uniref:DUF5133 domain-containing protein n=1 Tax=Streptomyces sp. NPDC091272 TaxID=3365981 RepID=UPI0038276C9E
MIEPALVGQSDYIAGLRIPPHETRTRPVLMPDPKTLRACLARFADARIAHVQSSRAGTEQELRDTSYTLCVMTGTRTVREALTVADRLLGRAALVPAVPVGGVVPGAAPAEVVPTAVPAELVPEKAVPGDELPLAAAA